MPQHPQRLNAALPLYHKVPGGTIASLAGVHLKIEHSKAWKSIPRYAKIFGRINADDCEIVDHDLGVMKANITVES